MLSDLNYRNMCEYIRQNKMKVNFLANTLSLKLRRRQLLPEKDAGAEPDGTTEADAGELGVVTTAVQSVEVSSAAAGGAVGNSAVGTVAASTVTNYVAITSGDDVKLTLESPRGASSTNEVLLHSKSASLWWCCG
jgi:predicted RNA-binding protein with EMAP domain